MEPITISPNTTKGIEVLYFEEAEVSKMKGTHTSFATFGPLSVLYFKDYHRFVLQLNDWRYPILRRLTIIPESTDSASHSYKLPAMNGFSFHLRITKSLSPAALANLDTILLKKQETSPDDKLMRPRRMESNPKEVITETIKHIIQNVEKKIYSLKAGTKLLTFTKKRSSLKDITTKDFKKEAHSRFKKDFFKSSEKHTQEFLLKRKDNTNLYHMREYDDLLKTSDSDAPLMYLPKEEIEEIILSGKDVFTTRPSFDKKELMGELKEYFAHPRKSNSRTLREEKPGDRHPADTCAHGDKIPLSAEGMTHYQG